MREGRRSMSKLDEQAKANKAFNSAARAFDNFNPTAYNNPSVALDRLQKLDDAEADAYAKLPNVTPEQTKEFNKQRDERQKYRDEITASLEKRIRGMERKERPIEEQARRDEAARNRTAQTHSGQANSGQIDPSKMTDEQISKMPADAQVAILQRQLVPGR